MAYGFHSVFRVNLYIVWFVCDCVVVKDWFHGVLRLSKTNIMFRDRKILSIMKNGGVPKFLHTLVNWPRQLWTAITFSSELRLTSS